MVRLLPSLPINTKVLRSFQTAGTWLKLPAGKSLSATPFFDISGFKVMASWPGSDKACPRCKQVGHDSQSCPRRPASKTSKKHSSTSTKQPASTLPSSSTAVVSPVTADATADKDSPASDLSPPINDSSMEISTDSDSLPFDLSPNQVTSLNALTA